MVSVHQPNRTIVEQALKFLYPSLQKFAIRAMKESFGKFEDTIGAVWWDLPKYKNHIFGEKNWENIMNEKDFIDSLDLYRILKYLKYNKKCYQHMLDDLKKADNIKALVSTVLDSRNDKAHSSLYDIDYGEAEYELYTITLLLERIPDYSQRDYDSIMRVRSFLEEHPDEELYILSTQQIDIIKVSQQFVNQLEPINNPMVGSSGDLSDSSNKKRVKKDLKSYPNAIRAQNNEGYEFNKLILVKCDGGLSILKYQGKEPVLSIPFKLIVDGKALSIVKVESGAFSDNSELEEVSLPSYIESIGWGAFKGCSKLISVSLPPNITAIATSTFENCVILTDLILPDSVESIGTKAFANCASLRIKMSESLREISPQAFECCTTLTSISFGGEIRTIAKNAFRGCSSLKEVTIPDVGVTYDDAFPEDTAIHTVNDGGF